MRFELFVASRYLRAKRRQAVIGVITGISIAGVAAGVASLVVALAINNGFRQDLQDRLLGSTSHINLLRIQSDGIKDWRPLMDRLSKEPHIVATAPAIYEQVLISRGPRARGAVLKGMIPSEERKVSDLLNTVRIGSADALDEASGTRSISESGPGQGAARLYGQTRAGAPAPHQQTNLPPICRAWKTASPPCLPSFSAKTWPTTWALRRLHRPRHQPARRTHALRHGAQVQPLSRGRNFQLRLLRLRQFLGLHPPQRRATAVRPR